MFNPLLFYEAGKRKGIPQDYILRYDFNGDYLDKSINALNGVKTGTANFATGFKAGTQCLQFTAGCVKTPSNLLIGSNKISISFWIKTSQTALAVILELSSDFNQGANTFANFINNQSSNKIDVLDHSVGSNYNGGFSTSNVNDNTWKHIIITIDRSLAATSENSIYINNILSYTQNASFVFDMSTNFSNHILFIGQRNAASLPFVGSLQNLRIYNRIISGNERNLLLNE